jgi:hypothetical protein
MRISIEFKNRKYIVVYGKFIGEGATPKEAIENLITKFREEIGKFFSQ